MLFDTDILIWVEKGNTKAAGLIEETPECFVSVQTYMELLQGAGSRKRIQTIKDFVARNGFRVLPLTESIGHRALIYVEEYAPLSGIRAGDAIIAATAIENNLMLATGNRKHFESIPDLKFRWFLHG
ncbi:MAG: type II toxin-antitoxin system VapC family toxin [Candidatus Omnitrophica bacterium]|nr:type II toxin-antitoxin system VapC family toxin [Candidatus Omnitrophota bacterium]